MLAPKVNPPPKAQSPRRSPDCAPGKMSFKHNGMLLDEVFPKWRMLL
jgi:hypothetical protein